MDAIASGGRPGRNTYGGRDQSPPLRETSSERRPRWLKNYRLSLTPAAPNPARPESPPPASDNRCFSRLSPERTHFHQLPGEGWWSRHLLVVSHVAACCWVPSQILCSLVPRSSTSPGACYRCKFRLHPSLESKSSVGPSCSCVNKPLQVILEAWESLI